MVDRLLKYQKRSVFWLSLTPMNWRDALSASYHGPKRRSLCPGSSGPTWTFTSVSGTRGEFGTGDLFRVSRRRACGSSACSSKWARIRTREKLPGRHLRAAGFVEPGIGTNLSELVGMRFSGRAAAGFGDCAWNRGDCWCLARRFCGRNCPRRPESNWQSPGLRTHVRAR